MKQDLNKYEESAVIGYWRMGMATEIMAAIMDCTHFIILKTIHDYKRFVLDINPQKIIKKNNTTV